MTTAQTPTTLLAAVCQTNPSGPLLTFYDDATGERVELSATTLDNWVAKTANLLCDELAVEPGERLGPLLPPHWQSAVWMLAAWSVGLVVDFDDVSGCEVVVCAPSTLEEATAANARDTVAMALRPLGGPFTDPLPEGVLDYGAEVLAHGDHFTPVVPVPPQSPALRVDGRTWSASELVEAAAVAAQQRGLTEGDRLLTTANPAGPDGYLEVLLAPLTAAASVVLVRHLDPERQPRRIAEEQVSHTTGAST